MILSQVEHIVGLAITALSVLNVQPWRFFAHDDAIDVYVVPSRGLPLSIQPPGRVHPCGAAVFNLWELAASTGHRVARLLPNPHTPTHVANVRIGGPMTLPADEHLLANAMSRRRTRTAVLG